MMRSPIKSIRSMSSSILSDSNNSTFLTAGGQREERKRARFIKTLVISILGGAVLLACVILLIHYAHNRTDLTSEYYTVTQDPDTQWIYLDPKGAHLTTMIYFTGYGMKASESFQGFGKLQFAPLTTRIVIPQAQKFKNGIGQTTYSWFNIFQNP